MARAQLEGHGVDGSDSNDASEDEQSILDDAASLSSEAQTDAPPPELLEEELESVLLIKQADPSIENFGLQIRRKKKKTLDPVALAQKRVFLKLREERKTAQKARRKERSRAKKCKGANVDLEAFLKKTKERLEAKAVEAEVEATVAASAAAEITRTSQRGLGADLRSFVVKTRERLGLQAAALEKAADARAKAAKTRAAAVAAGDDLEQFRKKCEERIVQRLWCQLPQVKDCLPKAFEETGHLQFTRRRIAIVGAGPVGLWAATLISQKYRHLGNGTGCRRPDAPQIVVIEARPAESHCSRTDIRIALSSSTQQMLNQRTKSRNFASGMPVADIEEALIRRWKKVAHEEAKITFGQMVEDPSQFASGRGFDCILWAAGRRSLSDAVRKKLGCQVQVGDSEKVIVFQVGELSGNADAWQLGSLDLSGVAQQAAHMPRLRVMVRPGFGTCSCWVWLFGLSQDLVQNCTTQQDNPSLGNREAAATRAPDRSLAPGLTEALEDLLGFAFVPSSLHAATEAIQQRVKANLVTARWVDASYWSADRSVCELQLPSGSSVPLVLIGDAVCGKPFFTGTTLNRHLWDVSNLIDEVDFAYHGGGLELQRFSLHERRYQDYIRRAPEFRRNRCVASNQPPISQTQIIPLERKQLKPLPLPEVLSHITSMVSPKARPASSNSSRLSRTPSLPALQSGRSLMAAHVITVR